MKTKTTKTSYIYTAAMSWYVCTHCGKTNILTTKEGSDAIKKWRKIKIK